MNKRLYSEAQAASDRSDYSEAYAKAFRLVCEETALNSTQVRTLFDIISCCLEVCQQDGKGLPIEADLSKLFEVTSKFSDTSAHASLLFELAVCAYNREDYSLCEQLMRRAVRLIQSDLVEYKSSYLSSIELFVDSLCWQSKFDEAIVACEDWLKLAISELVENDIFGAKIHRKFADIYAAKGENALAESHLKQCIRLHENESCEYCADAQSAIEIYANFLEKDGRAQEAAQQRQRLSQ